MNMWGADPSQGPKIYMHFATEASVSFILKFNLRIAHFGAGTHGISCAQ
jgi:hypothetical protein